MPPSQSAPQSAPQASGGTSDDTFGSKRKANFIFNASKQSKVPKNQPTLFGLPKCKVSYSKTMSSKNADGSVTKTVIQMDKHIDEPQDSFTIQCPFCDFSTLSKAGYGSHIKKHSNRPRFSRALVFHEYNRDKQRSLEMAYEDDQVKFYTQFYSPSSRTNKRK